MSTPEEVVDKINELMASRCGMYYVNVGKLALEPIYPGKMYLLQEDEMATIKVTQLQMMEALRDARRKVMSEPKRQGIEHMHNEFYQQMANAQQQNLHVQGNLLGTLGLQGQQGVMGNVFKNPFGQIINNPAPSLPPNTMPYPGLRKAFGFLNKEWEVVAEKLGFKHDVACDAFIHPNGGAVTRRLIEDSGGMEGTIEDVFKRVLTPNIHWLEDRVNEVRVKLC